MRFSEVDHAVDFELTWDSARALRVLLDQLRFSDPIDYKRGPYLCNLLCDEADLFGEPLDAPCMDLGRQMLRRFNGDAYEKYLRKEGRRPRQTDRPRWDDRFALRASWISAMLDDYSFKEGRNHGGDAPISIKLRTVERNVEDSRFPIIHDLTSDEREVLQLIRFSLLEDARNVSAYICRALENTFFPGALTLHQKIENLDWKMTKQYGLCSYMFPKNPFFYQVNFGDALRVRWINILLERYK